MKWIGTQTIYDHVRLNKGITLDSVSITTIQSSGESFADNDTSLMTSAAIDDRINTAITAEDLDLTADSGTAAVDLNSQALAITGGTGVTTSATGQAATINVDASLSHVTTLAGLTSFGSAGATTNILAGDIDWYNPVTDGDPSFRIGKDVNECLQIRANYQSGTQSMQLAEFSTYTASGTAHDGRFHFNVDGTQILRIQDNGLDLRNGSGISIDGTDILTDNGSGAATLSNIDVLDSTTLSTIGRGPLPSLIIDGNISIESSDGAKIHVDNSDVTDVSSAGGATTAKYTTANFEICRLFAEGASVTTTDAATLYIEGAPSAGTNQTITNPWALWVDAGNARFDGNIDLEGDIDVNGTLETDALTIGGTALTSVCSPVAGHSSIATVGTIGTGTWEGTPITKAYLNADQGNITTVGTIGSGTWQGTAVASAYMASATASAKGAVELATDAEAVTATDTTRAVTPANLKARVSQIINLKGYATLQNDVYDFANSYQNDDEAPFQLDESYGSGTIGSGTEVNQSKLFRAGGFHVPFACTVSIVQSQITCNNAGNVSVALVEYRPSDAGSDSSDYPRTVYETIVNASDNNNNKVDTVTIDSADLDETAVPAGSHLMIMVKGDGTSAGGTLVVSVAVGLSW